MINIIKDESSIRSAILELHPVAREACQNMISRLPDMSNIENHKALLVEEMLRCLTFASQNNGIQQVAIENLVKSNGAQVITIAVSVIHLHRRNKKSSFLKNAAAVGIGFIIGSLFG